MRVAMTVTVAGLMLAACFAPQAAKTRLASAAMPDREVLEFYCKARGGKLKVVGGPPAANGAKFYGCDLPNARAKKDG